MDHSHMDHGSMGPGVEAFRCEMTMLFTWNTHNLCIVFHWWQVRSTPGLIFSLLMIVAIVAAYEALRAVSRRYELSVDKHRDELPRRSQVEVDKRAHIVKALLYALQTSYAFMLMLLFMTYNGWVMIAVAVGAFVGYVLFGNSTSATKDNACH